MNRLFFELYLDEDVDVLIATLLRARGFAATTALEAGQIGTTDVEQLAYSVSQKLTLLTHNRVDFEKLAQDYAAQNMTHYGIVLAVRRSPYEVVQRLLLLLNSVTADEMKNQIRYI